MLWPPEHKPVLLCMALSLLTIPVVSGLVNIASAARQGQCVDLTSTEPYMYVNKVSLIGCAEACVKSDLCTALEYQRLASLCRLFDGVITPTQCRGRALLLRADIMATPLDVCGMAACPKTDCGPVPAITDMTVLGNQIKLGSVVKYTCTWTGDVTYVTCLNSGVWSTLPSCTQPDCGAAPIVTGGTCSVLPSFDAQCTCNWGHIIDPDSHLGIVACNLGTWDSLGFTCEIVEVNGQACTSTADCSADANAICVRRKTDEPGKCFCNSYFSYNSISGRCDIVCTLSSSAFESANKVIYGYNINTLEEGYATSAACWQHCIDSYPNALSSDHGNNKCVCNSVTKQQVMDSDESEFSSKQGNTLSSKICL